jgi:hypothetical protein
MWYRQYYAPPCPGTGVEPSREALSVALLVVMGNGVAMVAPLLTGTWLARFYRLFK